jgi:amidase
VFKHFVTCGPLARNAADLRLMMQCLGAPSPRQLPFTSRARGIDKPFKLRGARIAYCSDWSGVVTDEDTERLLRRLLDGLTAAGATVVKAAPDHFDPFEAYEVWGRAHGFEYRAALPMGGPGLTPWLARAMMHAMLGGPLARYVGRGLTSSSKQYFAALERREELVEKMDDFLSKHDAWLTPVTCTPAFSHRRMGSPIEVNGQRVPYSLANGFYTCATAAAGNPIVATPIGFTRSGLPVGIQVHGRRGADARVIDAAEAIASLCPAPRWPE